MNRQFRWSGLWLLGLAALCQAGADDLDLWFDGAPVGNGAVVEMVGHGMIGVSSQAAASYADTNGIYIQLANWPAGGYHGQAVMSNDGLVEYAACDPANCSVWVYDPPSDHTCWIHNPEGAVQPGLQFEIPVRGVAEGFLFCTLFYYNPDWSIHKIDEFQISVTSGKDDLDLWFNGAPVAEGGVVQMSGLAGMIGVASVSGTPYFDANGLYIRLRGNGAGYDGLATMANEGVVLHPACDPARCSVWVLDPPEDHLCWFDNAQGQVQPGLQFEVPVLPREAGAVWCELGYYAGDGSFHAVDTMVIELSGGLAMDFETGSYAGWSTTGTAWGDGPIADNAGQGNISGWQGTWYANSLAAGETATGTLTSAAFRLEGDIRFLIAGRNHWPGVQPPYSHNYVSLRLLNGVEIDRVWAPDQDAFVSTVLRANGRQGRQVYLEVVDNGAAEGHSWLAVDDFHMVVGDINGDGVCGFGDLATLAECWLTNGTGCAYPADLNGDSGINLVDVGAVSSVWGERFPVRFDFCSGTLGDWTTTGTAFGISSRPNYGAECDYHVESLAGGESATGTLRSPDFYVSDESLLFLASGWNGYNGHTGENGYRLRRASDQAILRQAYPPNDDAMHLRIMDVADLQGERVYFEVYDNDTENGWAWLGLDRLWSYTPSASGKWRPDMFVIGIGWPTVNFVGENDRAAYLQNLAGLNLNLLMLESGMPEVAEPYGMMGMIYEKPMPLSVVHRYQDHPLTWGYFQWDEPKSNMFPQLATYHAEAHFVDPLKPSYTNLQSINYGISRQDVLNFVSTVQPEILSFDFYHWYWHTFWNGYPTLIENLDFFREVAANNDIPLYSWVEVNADGSGGMENRERYRYSVYLNLVYGVKGIMWFNAAQLFDCADAATIPNSGAIINQGYYDDVKAINAELQNLGPELVKLRSTAVYHNGIGQRSGDHAASMDPIPAGYWIQILTNGMTLGMFTNDGREDYAMIMNRDKDYGNTVRVQFGEAVSRVQLFDEQTGTWSDVAITGTPGSQEVSFYIGGGYGKLIKITRAS